MADMRVPIDLNDVDADGLTLVLLRLIDDELTVGQRVVAFEAEDGIQAPAKVEVVNHDYGVALVRVDWSMTKKISHPNPVLEALASQSSTNGARMTLKVATSRGFRSRRPGSSNRPTLALTA